MAIEKREEVILIEIQKIQDSKQTVRDYFENNYVLNSFDFPPYILKSTSTVSLNNPLNPIISKVLSDIPVKFRCQFFT